ncbi:MAG: hypothetical protein OEO79_05860 [Gemmatimonadota bacterium]|nr:hypothetical protein [Gemmatimonadota bacterium]MDH3423617.1 hypothetical protein [Gemmatimonadota bacterium]
MAAGRAGLLVLALAFLQACGGSEPADEAGSAPATETLLAEAQELTIDASSFGCLAEMTQIRHFFVDNLLGDVAATVAVAESTEGGVYPPGSVVQLVPTEVMVKHPSGYSPATRDWEFFELGVTAEGTSITMRGSVDVVNRFGGNCLDCHIKAEPQFDLICELDHGCDPIPVTREQIAAVQAADPRCME